MTQGLSPNKTVLTCTHALKEGTQMAVNTNSFQSHETSETYLSDNQLAKRYDVSRVTIWRWASQGRLATPVKLSPGCTRWRMSDVLEFEKSVA